MRHGSESLETRPLSAENFLGINYEYYHPEHNVDLRDKYSLDEGRELFLLHRPFYSNAEWHDSLSSGPAFEWNVVGCG